MNKRVKDQVQEDNFFNPKTNPIDNINLLKNDLQPKEPKPSQQKKENLVQLQKVGSNGNVNTYGTQSLVMYKKPQQNNTKINTNINTELPNYLSDGGLQQRTPKYNKANNNVNNAFFNNYTNNNNNSRPNNKNLKNLTNPKKTHNNTNTNTTNPNNNKTQRIFSKTVRGYNKRPAFDKNNNTGNNNNTNSKRNLGIKKKQIRNDNHNNNPNINNNNNYHSYNNNINQRHHLKNKSEDSKNPEEKKQIYMQQLISNGVASEMRKLRAKKEPTLEEMLSERKKDYLEEIGSPVNLESEGSENEEEKNEELNGKENNIHSKTTRAFYPKKNNNMNHLFIDPEEETSLSQSLLKEKKNKPQKPQVNPFEFLNRIKIEQRKLPNHSETPLQERKDSEFTNIINDNNINNNLNSNNKNTTKYNNLRYIHGNRKTNQAPQLNDSFRHKNQRKKNLTNSCNNNIGNNKGNKDVPVEGSIQRTIDDINDEFPFAHKKTHRKPEEIQQFILDKKNQKKKEQEEELMDKNKKLFLHFKNLYNLSMKESNNNFLKKNANNINNIAINMNLNSNANTNINTNTNRNIEKLNGNNTPKQINITQKKNNIRNNCKSPPTNNNNNNNNNNNCGNNNAEKNDDFRKKKEINDYYIGNNDSTIKNNNSTVVDPGEYYLNILESQQLVVNSGLNRIENENLDGNQINYKDSSLTKELLKKISIKKNIQKQDELREKIVNTLQRANKVFGYDEIINNYNINNNNPFVEKKAPEINIETSNATGNSKPINIDINEDTNSNKNTNEKNLPSLTHSFPTNSNPNKKVEVEIEPRNVVNLVGVLKFIIQRKVFVKIYEFYINKALYQRYNLAFSFFVVICKHYPFAKIEEYCNYIAYNNAFMSLFKPYIKNLFKHFVNKCKNFNKKTEEKKKEEKKKEEKKKEEKKKEEKKKEEKKKEEKKKEEKTKEEKKKEEKKKEEKKMEEKKKEEKKKEEKKKEDKKKEDDTGEKCNKITKVIKKIINPRISEAFKNIRNKEYDISAHRRANDNSIKMNSYLYESLNSQSKSSLLIEPNSEDNDKLHQLKVMLMIKRNIANGGDGNLNDSDNDNELGDDDMLEQHSNFSHSNKSSGKKLDNENKRNFFRDKKSLGTGGGGGGNEEKNIKEEEKLFNNNNNNNKGNKNADDDNNNNNINSDLAQGNIKEKNPIEIKIEKNDDNDCNECSDGHHCNSNSNSNNIRSSINESSEEALNRKSSGDVKIQEELLLDQEDITQKEKSRNPNKEVRKDSLESEKEKEKEKKTEEKKDEIESLEKLKEVENPEKLANELTEAVIDKILLTEIKLKKKKLIPIKKFKYDKFDKMNNNTNNSKSNSLNNSYGSVGNAHDNFAKEFSLGGISQLSLADELLSLNDSLMSNYSANSVFNKNIKEKKKEHSLSLYFKHIAPKLIRLIRKEIYDKYPRIYANLSTPMKNNSPQLLMSLALQDAEMLRENYKSTKNVESIDKIIDKDKLLATFKPINKKIRGEDVLSNENSNNYDNMLNECIIETAIELINKEKLYGKNGEPLKWSSRTHELAFKYDKKDPKKLADFVCKNLIKSLHNRIGLIDDNYEYMTSDQINIEKDRRLTNIIKKDLNENEYQWNNLEMEETQLKVDSTELILEQLYNEVIEILEHIQYSRIRPDLYQYKSIYACEEIPKLDFQLTTTEDATLRDANENDIINI